MADLRSVFSGFDLDSGAGSELILGVSLRLSASGGSNEAIGQKAMASSLPVVIASDQSAVSVDTELPAAASLTDNFANPTAPAVGAFTMVWDGATWDRAPGNSAGGVYAQGNVAHDAAVSANPLLLGGYASAAAPTGVSADGDAVQAWFLRNGAQSVVVTAAGALVGGDATNGLDVDVTRVTGTVTVDSELPSAASLTDDFANPTAPAVGAFGMVWDGSTWDRMPGTSALGVTVNTELPAAASLTDNFANPTAPAVGAFAMGWDGSAWDRVSVVNGVLQVDVLSGAGSTTPTSPATDYVTSAAVAAGAEANLDTGDLPGKSLAQVTVWSSVAYRARVFLVNNSVEATEALAVGGGQAFSPWIWEPPHADYATLGTSGGTDAFRVEFVSLDDSNASDAHAVFVYQG